MRDLRLILALALLPLTIALGACGEDQAAGMPRVVASTGVMADLAESLAGDDIAVQQLIPDGASPHAFTISARDRAALEDAALVVLAGGDIEAGLPTEDLKAPQWQLLDQVPDPLPARDEGGDPGEGIDPHAWLDPSRVSAAIPSLVEALAGADPAHAAAYRRRGRGLRRELRRLDTELESKFRQLAPTERLIVTSHDSLGYLADRYGLKLLATPFGTVGPEGEVSAARLQEVIDAVTEAGAVAVYTQLTDSADVIERVADEAGVEVRTGLLVESPGDAGSYVEMMRRNATVITGR